MPDRRRESTIVASLLPILALALTGCRAEDTRPVAPTLFDSASAAIGWVACWSDFLESSGAICGLLEVPASYQGDSSDGPPSDLALGATRRVSFAALPALDDSASPEARPVVFLIGGPGRAGSFASEFADDGPGAFLRRDRQLILVDYRGVGMSEPYLGCDGPEDLEECKRALDDSGMVDELRSAVFARDVDRLLGELGLESVSIFAGSYGTRVALTMMRDVPQRVSHVVLDSVFPPEVNGFSQGARSVLAGLGHLADRCGESPECVARLGDIRSRIADLASSWAGREDAVRLLETLATFSHNQAGPLWVRELSAMTPEESSEQVLLFAEEEDSDEDEEDSPEGSERAESLVMTFGVVCSEEAAFIDRQPLDETLHGLSEAVVDLVRNSSGGAPFSPSEAKEVCGMLGIPPAPDIEIAPVESDIPALLFSGGMDLQTSFEWGELAAGRLENARHFVFPFASHMVLLDDPCAQGIASRFLADPNSDLETACLEEQRRRSEDLVLESPDIVAELKKELQPKDE